MIKFFSFTFLFLLSSQTWAVIGGDPWPGLELAPWQQVSLAIHQPGPVYNHLCGGTIIGRQTVISAAHCFKNILNSKDQLLRTIEIRLGLDNSHPSRRLVIAPSVVQIHLKKERDLAVLTFQQPLFEDHYQKELKIDQNKLQNKMVFVGQGCTGITFLQQEVYTDATTLLHYGIAKNIIESNFEYNSYSRFFDGTTPGLCLGDSGGGLFMVKNNKAILIGVNSSVDFGPDYQDGFSRFIRINSPEIQQWIVQQIDSSLGN